LRIVAWVNSTLHPPKFLVNRKRPTVVTVGRLEIKRLVV
jgi:hypothetical protein